MNPALLDRRLRRAYERLRGLAQGGANQRGVVRFLFLLALLAAGGWYIHSHGWPGNPLKPIGGRLENDVNQELTRLQITDHDIRSQLRKERSWLGLQWVETDRQIDGVDPKRLSEITQSLSRLSRRKGWTFIEERGPEETSLEIKRFFLLFQRLTFRPLAAIPQDTAPQVAFVIDDVAYDAAPMDRFASLGVPLTFAILPRDRRSKELAQKAHAMNFAVMLHLPMEPHDLANNNPGGAALYLKMTPHELRKQFEKDVESVPHIAGINNHMGSAFTEDEGKMTLVMQWVKEKDLFFLDSRTSTHSVASQVAKRVGVPCLMNEVFLDNEDNASFIEKQLDQVLALAVKRRRAIAIGHYRRKHLVEALSRKLPEFHAQGVKVVALPTFYR